MDLDVADDAQMEIAHVLFLDIIGYSKLLTSEQRERQQELNRIVRETEQFREAEAAGKLIRVPTGDGMVLAFFTTPDAPVRCAIAISRALHGTSHLPLRIGVHSGPVDMVEDVNDKPNLAGAGVNMAQRVMDCGDAGHILLSARAADDLAQHAQWHAQLHDLGEIEVKHGVRVRVSSLHAEQFGNPALPVKMQRARAVRRRRMLVFAGAALGLIGLAVAGSWAYRHQLAVRARAAAEALAQLDKSVAVLPFENLDPEDQNAVFAGGVHREVLSNLAKIAALKVISRTSVMRYKPGVVQNVRQIAAELGVAYLVEGSVQRAAAHVRVIVELIDARTERQAWSETYDGTVADVLAFQSEIAQRITNQLGAKLSPRESNALAGRATKDIAAFESYIRARALAESVHDGDDAEHERFVQGQRQTIELLQQALARDPDFLLAYCALAEANILLLRSGNASDNRPELRAAAEAALNNAERIAPEAGETLYAKSRFIYYVHQDFHGALEMLERAAKLLPNSADVTLTRGLLYRRFGRWQEAYAQFMRTTELNPKDPDAYQMLAMTAAGLRWWDDEDRAFTRAVARFPQLAEFAKKMTTMTLRLRGDVEAGDKLMDDLHLTTKDGFGGLFYRAMWHRNYAECRRLVDEAATIPELETERWDKEARLAYVTKDFRSRPQAIIAEKKLQARVENASDEQEKDGLMKPLVALKFMAGKADEGVRLVEESVRKHPVSEDALVNQPRLELLVYAYLFAGDHERAIETLAKVTQLPSLDFACGRMKYDPVLDDLRTDPRFAQLLEQSKQPFPRL